MKKYKPTITLLTLLLLLTFAQNISAQCSGNQIPPVANCQASIQLDVSPGSNRTIEAGTFDAGSYDDCSASNLLQFFIEIGPPSASPPSTTELTFSDTQAGTYSIVLWVVDEQGNAANCTSSLEVNICQSTPALVCNDNVVVSLGPNYTAEVDAFDMLEGGPYCNYNDYEVRLGQAGNFAPVLNLGPGDIGTHLMTVQSNNNLCWGTLTVLPGALVGDCPLMFVDMATWAIRPCFSNRYYVTYINGSTQTIAYTYVDVALDSRFNFESSEIPEDDLGNNVYRFQTGDLAPGEYGRFWIQFNADCNDPVGTTYCSEASIYPDTTCPGLLPWSGAEIKVEGTCNNDSVFFTIKNIGAGAMTKALDYIVVEDVLMRQSGTFNLSGGQSMSLDPILANGATIRLEVEQEPSFPYGGRPALSVEGCGGFTQGMVTQFPNDISDPFNVIDCRESTASYDPNDKQALPKGVGTEHIIEPDAALNYMIRFQNTGTDTAFRVVLVDTLSSLLNSSSVRPGASSHPYTWEMTDGNILRFTFENILLPDSNVNEPASHGFVQFAIAQTPDNPDGAIIENTAAIFFDFNAPVLTNQTTHKIGNHIITVSAEAPSGMLPAIQVYPNPAVDVVHFNIERSSGRQFRFELSDANGRLVRQMGNVDLPLRLDCSGLPAGTYFFRLQGAKDMDLWSGQVIVH